MATKRQSAEQIVRKLREAEVELAKGATVQGRLPEAGNHRAHLLPVASGVRRAEAGPGEAFQATREGKRPAQEDCGGEGARPVDSQGGWAEGNF